MSPRLNWNEVRDRLRKPLEGLAPYGASELVLALGAVANWCLRPEVLAKARDDQSVSASIRNAWRVPDQIPVEHGGCWVAFAADEELTLLRPAFVFPLRWREAQEHSNCLPHSLTTLADRVLADLAVEKTVAAKRWRLEPSSVLARTDLGQVELKCESGWAALAAGLLIAAEKGTVNPRIWATASWDGGITPVGSLSAKIELAAESADLLFVPEQQESEACEIVRSRDYRLEIGRLTQGENNPRSALKNYLRSLKVRPSLNDAREIRASYYLSPDLDEAGARDFYRNNLMPEIVENCRGHLANESQPRAVALITIASDNSELVSLGIEALQPSQCLVLYTANYADRTASARAMAQNNTVGCRVIEKEFPTLEALREGMASAIHEFTSQFAPSDVVFDLTPGPKDVSFAWMLDMAPPESRLHYLRHSIAENLRRVIPFSERPRVWTAGQSLGARPRSSTGRNA